MEVGSATVPTVDQRAQRPALPKCRCEEFTLSVYVCVGPWLIK
jgi:hypothetical protein